MDSRTRKKLEARLEAKETELTDMLTSFNKLHNESAVTIKGLVDRVSGLEFVKAQRK